MCDIGVFGSLNHLLVLVQKCCIVGRRSFSWLFHIFSAALRLGVKDAAQTPWEMLMDKSQLVSFARKTKL